MTRKRPHISLLNRVFDIPPVDKSLRRDFLAGAITIEQARDEFIHCGWFCGNESITTTYRRLGLLPEIKRIW